MLARALRKPTSQSSAFDTPAERRGRLKADRPGEFHYEEMNDYVALAGSLLRKSHMKYSNVAKATGMCSATASNLAAGRTHYPRFTTIANVLGALGYETVIRAGPTPQQRFIAALEKQEKKAS